MTPDVLITHPRQLLVEGRTAKIFFNAFLAARGFSEIDVQSFGGVTDLRGFLRAFVRSPGFGAVKALGVVRDAESDATAACESVRAAFRQAGLSQPTLHALVAAGTPATGIFILPDGRGPGMLETLCLAAVGRDPSFACVEDFVRCLGERGAHPAPLDKARAQAFLASRARAGLEVGRAAQTGYWPLEGDAFDPLAAFLAELLA